MERPAAHATIPAEERLRRGLRSERCLALAREARTPEREECILENVRRLRAMLAERA